MKTFIVLFCTIVMLLMNNVKGFASTEMDDIILAVSQIESETKHLDISPLYLIDSPLFNSTRKNLAEKNIKEIVLNIQIGKLSKIHTHICIYLLASSLTEEQYWKAVYPLLASIEEPMTVNRILLPIPFGPGLMNAFDISPYKEILMKLKPRFEGTSNTVGVIDYILSGNAAKDNKKMREDPAAFNIEPSHIKLFSKSWYGKE